MNALQQIATLWNWSSLIWLVGAGLVLAYLAAFRDVPNRRKTVFVAGVVVLLLCYLSPVGVLADGTLFSAHMIQHLVLLLVVPLLLLLGLPREPVAAWLDRSRVLDRVARFAAVPVVGWMCGLGAMWFWHVPVFCSASTENAVLGAFRDTTFVLAGLTFWWPIYSPVERFRLPPLPGIVYLFSACLGCTLLGVYITFTTISVCPAFAQPVDHGGVLAALFKAGYSPGVDQHLGGLLMWVPPCTLYVCAIMSMLRRWYFELEESHAIRPARTRQQIEQAQM